MIEMATRTPFDVANDQTYVMIAHSRVSGAVTVSGPSLSAKYPDDIRPTPDPAFAMRTK